MKKKNLLQDSRLPYYGTYNKVVKSKIKNGSDMLKSSTYLCNRDRTYLKKIHNAEKLPTMEVPVTTADKLLALGFITQTVEFSKADVAEVNKIIRVGEVSGSDLFLLKNLLFKNLKKRSVLKITKEGQNALTVSIVANIKI